MSEPDLLYTSGEPDEIAELEKILKEAPGLNLEIFPGGAALLREYMNLPFIQKPNGGRIVGIEAIRDYLQNEAASVRR